MQGHGTAQRDVPPPTSVLPLNVFVAASVSVPLSILVKLPAPESEPERVTARPAVSNVALPPATNVIGKLDERATGA